MIERRDAMTDYMKTKKGWGGNPTQIRAAIERGVRASVQCVAAEYADEALCTQVKHCLDDPPPF
jgi:hypothetical protein